MANYASNYTGLDLDNSIKLSKGSIAPLYSASSTYEVDAYVIYNGDLYKCNTAVTSPEAFDATKWDRRKVTDMVAEGGKVTGVKGAAESTYRIGDVNITLGNLGVTATAAELNVLDGITVTTEALNKINEKMTFKGTVGTAGTVTTLPTSNVNVGDMYKVVTLGTYAGQAAKVGDLFIATATTPVWCFIPAGPAIVSGTTLIL